MPQFNLLEKVQLGAVAVDKNGTVTVDAVEVPVFFSSDPSVAAVEIDANGVSFLVGKSAGSVTVTVTGKVNGADLGGSSVATVVPAPAVALQITFSDPQSQS